MPNLDETANIISRAHKDALIWFIENQGQQIEWRSPLPDGTFLVNRPKGFHKPRGWKYALSVRQMLTGPYADAEPALQADGSWHYQYFQEGTEPGKPDEYFTNTALMECIKDGVPIGVLRQISEEPLNALQNHGISVGSRVALGWFFHPSWAQSAGRNFRFEPERRPVIAI